MLFITEDYNLNLFYGLVQKTDVYTLGIHLIDIPSKLSTWESLSVQTTLFTGVAVFKLK